MSPRTSLVVVFAIATLGCGGESASPTSGGDGGQATTSSSTVATSSTSSASSGGGGGGPVASSSSTGGGAPECVPLSKPGGAAATPGHCVNDAAVTCDDEAHLVTTTCAAGEKCLEYPVEEYIRDPQTNFWSSGRTLTWAGCVLDDAVTCAFVWDVSAFQAVDQPTCDAGDRTACTALPLPAEGMNATVGSLDGFIERLPCDAGTICAGSASVGSLECIPADTPLCTGDEPVCAADGSGVLVCVGAWESPPGHQELHTCGSGTTCRPGCAAATDSCIGSDEVACDRTTFVNACSEDGTGWTVCNGCYTLHQDCTTCEDMDSGETVACRCGHEQSAITTNQNTCSFSTSGPECIPKAKPDCDRATDSDFCDGTVAHRCLGYYRTYDCASYGDVCQVANGIAGCAKQNANACSPSASGSCSGNVVTHCCEACGSATPWSFLGPDASYCVPGFETKYDCSLEDFVCESLGGVNVCTLN